MDPSTAVEVITSAGTALTAAGRAAPDAPVPSCPGWTVSTVVKHVGQVHSWAAANVREGSTEMQPFPAQPELAGDALVDWADAARESLVSALASADPEHPVWTFAGTAPAWFWWRRQCHETAVHAWDATAAAGGGGAASGWVIPADVADDGVDEFLTFLERILSRGGIEWGAGKTIHLHRTDGSGERLVEIASPPVVTAGHARGDLAVRGPAADLLLWAMNRAGRVELFGDTNLAEAWRDNVKI